jgi:hypothetical protein
MYDMDNRESNSIKVTSTRDDGKVERDSTVSRPEIEQPGPLTVNPVNPVEMPVREVR